MKDSISLRLRNVARPLCWFGFAAALLTSVPMTVLAQDFDLEPPKLVNLVLNPASLDLSSGPQTVTVFVEVTDNLSGVDYVHVRLGAHPANSNSACRRDEIPVTRCTECGGASRLFRCTQRTEPGLSTQFFWQTRPGTRLRWTQRQSPRPVLPRNFPLHLRSRTPRVRGSKA